MKFIYGKQDFKSMERGEENCWLLTNGLGGFSSATMIGSASRNDHALLMAGVKAPNHRYNLIHRLSECLDNENREKRIWISSQAFADADAEPEDGYRHLSAFSYEDAPEWLYQACGVEIRKEIGMEQWENTVAVRYRIDNRSRQSFTFTVTPFLQFTGKGVDLTEDQKFTLKNRCIRSAGLELYVVTDGIFEEIPPVYETCRYAYDACDGRRDQGRALANHRIRKEVPAGGSACLNLIFTMENDGGKLKPDAGRIIENMKNRREQLADQSGFRIPEARQLAKSADQFISRRESTGGETILAGYPFFEDWGRDTMIALAGVGIAAGRWETVKSILRTFLKYRKKGLLPNLFPEGENKPAYNTVDAALLFIITTYLYEEKTGDMEFVREAYPAMQDIIRWYREGTDYGIHMDEDGLLMAGGGYDQVTWMDVRVGDILPTPRHGKPVEINAYWYNSLRIMETFAERISGSRAAAGYAAMASKAAESFEPSFWMEEKHCLKDVVSGTAADTQIRCNQIWAVSLPFALISPKKEKQVVETVFEKLYTPYGLRTLSMEDEEFHKTYGGSQLSRDLAYHQGTVWVFPLGAYYLAYLKVNHYETEAVQTVRRQLKVMECALREGCIGQLPEIYDGENPTSSKGCFAQAWSVGELLRVYEALEQHGIKES